MGRAVIQTYNPDSPLLQAAINQDYKAFYDKEIAERAKFKFPPFYSLLKISCRRASAKSAEAACQKLKALIEQELGLKVEGPAPSFHEKNQGKFEWQLVVKATNRNRLLEAIKLLPTGWTYDIDPSNLL
jgi:primosomal protein N' (replication factor Y)